MKSSSMHCRRRQLTQAGGDRYRAYRRYAAMAQDFSGLHDVAEVEKKARELSATKEIKDGLKQEKRIEEEQIFRIQSIHKTDQVRMK